MSILADSVGGGAGVMPSRSSQRPVQLIYVLLALPLIAYMVFFYVVPVGLMLTRSVMEPTWTLANFERLLDPLYLRIFWVTFRIALMVTAVVVVLGYPVGLALVRMNRSLSNIMIILVLLPLWTSVLVRTYAWMVLLGRQGIVNETLVALNVIAAPIRLLNTTFAVLVAMVHILLPFMILPLYGVLSNIDPSILRAAAGLGASPRSVFLRVILPLSMSGVLAGSLLVFILSLGFFITPALVGGPQDIMISMFIQQQVDLFHWPFASALATVLLLLTLGIVALCYRALGADRWTSGLGR